jgi:hypothetical protein
MLGCVDTGRGGGGTFTTTREGYVTVWSNVLRLSKTSCVTAAAMAENGTRGLNVFSLKFHAPAAKAINQCWPCNFCTGTKADSVKC